jgi:hypothetical protein
MSNETVLRAFDQVELTESELVNVTGGYAEQDNLQAAQSASAGYICSLSAECNTGGTPCNPMYWGH